ncbi:hypothetical protein JKP88DRAFT_169116, partial [Tribonema minus]
MCSDGTDYKLPSEKEWRSGFCTHRARPDFNNSLGVVVFIHGYNVTEKGAVETALKLQNGLNCPVVAFDWASHGREWRYTSDRSEATAEATGQKWASMMQTLRSLQVGVVHIIAHSMGNLV